MTQQSYSLAYTQRKPLFEKIQAQNFLFTSLLAT